MSNAKIRIYAFLGTVIAMLLLFLLLWFVYIDPPYMPEEEGIEVSFGDGDFGGGVEPLPQPAAVTETTAPTPVHQDPSPNDLMTQDDEEALALQKQKKEQEEKRKAEEQERIRKQKEEEARLEAERIAQEKALAEQRAKEQQAIDNANKLGSLFGNQTSASGSGQTSGSTTQGNPAGRGSSGGNSWSLTGRSLQGTLKSPAYSSNQEGRIVVQIRVNAEGRVVSASVTSGTTISDKKTQQDAIAEAKKAVFSKGTGDVVGTITYNYKLK